MGKYPESVTADMVVVCQVQNSCLPAFADLCNGSEVKLSSCQRRGYHVATVDQSDIRGLGTE